MCFCHLFSPCYAFNYFCPTYSPPRLIFALTNIDSAVAVNDSLKCPVELAQAPLDTSILVELPSNLKK